jgi:hypothetical protein
MTQPILIEEADDIVMDVRSLLRNDDRKPQYRWNPNPMFGQCYVASETVYHLLGGKHCPAVLYSYQMRWEGESHWFLVLAYKVIDPTFDQFEEKPKYEYSTRRAFMSPSPSKRTRAVMRRYYNAKLRGTLPSQINTRGDRGEEAQELRGSETMGGASAYGEGK